MAELQPDSIMQPSASEEKAEKYSPSSDRNVESENPSGTSVDKVEKSDMLEPQALIIANGKYNIILIINFNHDNYIF